MVVKNSQTTILMSEYLIPLQRIVQYCIERYISVLHSSVYVLSIWAVMGRRSGPFVSPFVPAAPHPISAINDPVHT